MPQLWPLTTVCKRMALRVSQTRPGRVWLGKGKQFCSSVSITGDPRYESKEEVKKTTGQRRKPGEMEKKDPGFRLQGEKVKEKARSDACIS